MWRRRRQGPVKQSKDFEPRNSRCRASPTTCAIPELRHRTEQHHQSSMAPASFSAATFDIRGLSYLSHIDDNLCCPICHSPLIDPVSTQCRHTFCNECICGALEQSVTCPVDRKPLQPEDISMAPIMIANLVNDLVVLCPNSELGCATSCPRYLIGRHLEDNCQFVAVKCSGCKEAILRKDSESQCMHQEIECEFCFTKIRKSDSQVLPIRNFSQSLRLT